MTVALRHVTTNCITVGIVCSFAAFTAVNRSSLFLYCFDLVEYLYSFSNDKINVIVKISINISIGMCSVYLNRYFKLYFSNLSMMNASVLSFYEIQFRKFSDIFFALEICRVSVA